MASTSGHRGRIVPVVENSTIVEIAGEREGVEPRRGPTDEALLRMCQDLVTPAVTIRQIAQAIEAEPGMPPSVYRRAAQIAAESDRVSEICAFTLEAVREARPTRLDWIVAECVDSVRAWFRGTIEEKTDSVTVQAPRVPMLRLVSNLLNNACQAAGPDGDVLVTLGFDDEFAILELVNTGDQLDPSLFPGPECGSGTPSTLGLRIVAGILEDHHGQLHVDERPLQGTVVRVLLPLGSVDQVPSTGPPIRSDQ